VSVPKVDRAVAAAIARGRAAKELNQKEFAVVCILVLYYIVYIVILHRLQKINEPIKVVVDYEQGKAIPNQAILAKMERVLGVKLVCSFLILLYLSNGIYFGVDCHLSIHYPSTCLYFFLT
jgi:transcriptional regulator with XRE-family HTH domain